VQYVKIVDGTGGGTAGLPGDGTNGLKVNAASVVTALGTIDGHVDGLETLVTSTNTKLDTVNTNLGTIDGRVDGLETLVTSTNTKLDTIGVTAPTNSTTTALDNDGPVVKASAGTLYGFQGYSDAAGFVQVHNKATAPASTNVPVIVIYLAAAGNFSLDLGIRGRAFSTGIAFGFSSTGPTYTDGGSHLWVDAQYV
jgi:hypothetical protein